METSTVRMLMTGAGAPGAAGIIRCLKKSEWLQLFLCDSNPHAVGRYLTTDSYHVVPRATDPEFKDAILAICRENGISIIMPLVTKELFVFAAHKDEFLSAGVRVLVSDERSLNIANNKSDLYAFLNDKTDVVPSFHRVSTVSEFEAALSALGYPEKKVCFKPSISNGSRGFRIIDPELDAFDLLFNYKPNNAYIDVKKAVEILSARQFPELLVSEYLPGEEYSVDCLAMNGETVIAVPRLRKKMLEGISVEGQMLENQELINASRNVIKLIGLHGNIGIQFKRAENGRFKILEINPRVQGTIVAVMGAGVNLPLLAVKQELGLATRPEESSVKWGTNFIRFWDEVFY